jgi:hypothetical protein
VETSERLQKFFPNIFSIIGLNRMTILNLY